MTGLRQDLEAALANALWDDCDLVLAIEPIIAAAVAAAEKQMAERLIDEVEKLASEYGSQLVDRDKQIAAYIANHLRDVARGMAGSDE